MNSEITHMAATQKSLETPQTKNASEIGTELTEVIKVKTLM